MSAIRYTNQRATRSLPLSPELERALGFLPELGITAEVFSGGQAAKGSGGPRTGSVRHDHGNAADVRFYQGDRQLDWANPDDLPLFQEIVQRGKANGLTGFGAGPGYMSPGTMHVGFGAPGVWGAGGRGQTLLTGCGRHTARRRLAMEWWQEVEGRIWPTVAPEAIG